MDPASSPLFKQGRERNTRRRPACCVNKAEEEKKRRKENLGPGSSAPASLSISFSFTWDPLNSLCSAISKEGNAQGRGPTVGTHRPMLIRPCAISTGSGSLPAYICVCAPRIYTYQWVSMSVNRDLCLLAGQSETTAATACRSTPLNLSNARFLPIKKKETHPDEEFQSNATCFSWLST